MSKLISSPHALAVAALLSTLALSVQVAHAAPVQIKVTAENLVAANGISFAPLRVGFGNGSFDAFNLGGVATAPIISVAEGGSGVDWFPAFAAADPGATLGTVVPSPPGPLVPGGMGMTTFMLDPALSRFFTFASMAVPSNDLFIGNDDPMEYDLLDAAGNLQITSITVRANEIWDAGSEVFDPAAAAFVAGGTNSLRTNQNSVVAFNFAELAAFNGMTTGAAYVLNSQLRGSDEVYRISFSVVAVPEPESYALMLAGLVGVAFVARRRSADHRAQRDADRNAV